jgi:hypothetical protein
VTALLSPLDVGNGLICASFAVGGEWLSLATVDPRVGFVELTGMPPFDEAWRGDRDAVRRYRSWMREADHAFLRVDAGLAAVTTRQEAPRGTRCLTQQVRIQARPSARPTEVRIRFRGRLARPAYAEITEVDPPDWHTEPTKLEVGKGTLCVRGDGPPVIVRVRLVRAEGGSLAGTPNEVIPWRLRPGGMPLAEARVEWPRAADEVCLDVACAFDLPVTPADERRPTRYRRTAGVTGGPSGQIDRPLLVPTRLATACHRLSQNAVGYVRDCTALRVGDGERCILADHRILPLSWTRDAYWQARLLLSTASPGGGPDDVEIVADHLRWLFLRCERPDGRWLRSHHADGARKDRSFQADQQLYPILELTDYAQATGTLPELPAGATWHDLIATAWSAVEAAIDPGTGLIGADENPADDTLSRPFLLSNQILLWRVATSLAGMAGLLAMPATGFERLASRTKAAVAGRFVVGGPLGRQWAYAVDGNAGIDLYHDANDLPVALAPLWRFCPSDDATWRTTMRFAVSPANPGWVPGPYGGLGSRHTPGVWTLGDLQRWASAGLRGDRPDAEAALERLIAVADQEGGSLPEAYDLDGAGTAIRHWFAWPGAAFGVLFLEHARIGT